MSGVKPYLDEIQLVQAQVELVGRGHELRGGVHLVQIMAVGGDNVGVREVGGDGRL